MQFLGVRKCCSSNIFLTPNRNMFAGRLLKWEKILAVFQEHIIFNVKWVETRKMSDLFRWLLLPLRLSAGKSGIERNSDDVQQNLWTKAVCPKRITNMRFWIIYILVQCSFFWRTALGPVFVLVNFSLSANHGSWHYYSPLPPHHQKASCGPAITYSSVPNLQAKMIIFPFYYRYRQVPLHERSGK